MLKLNSRSAVQVPTLKALNTNNMSIEETKIVFTVFQRLKRECPRRPRGMTKIWHMLEKLISLISRPEIPHDELITVVYFFVQIYFCFPENSQKLYRICQPLENGGH